MDIRGPYRASNAPCCLDLLRGHLGLSIGLLFGLVSRPNPRIAGCRGDDLFVAAGSGSGSICDLPIFRRSSRVIDLHRRIRRHHRNRNDLVVACSSQQVLKWTMEAGDPIDQFNAHPNPANRHLNCPSSIPLPFVSSIQLHSETDGRVHDAEYVVRAYLRCRSDLPPSQLYSRVAPGGLSNSRRRTTLMALLNRRETALVPNWL